MGRVGSRQGRRLYAEDTNHRSPSLRCLLVALENKLEQPQAERLTLEELFGTQERAHKYLRRYLHNQLRFPTTGIAEMLEN